MSQLQFSKPNAKVAEFAEAAEDFLKNLCDLGDLCVLCDESFRATAP
jgi:hypothetical protein